ncbi:hypothetical protein [Nannocystis punicea]|uniref:DUF4034 domain-containing protein n=1 Tax=Nannocystis punicea TaxID=2995304 RepID=A0ABY7H3P8_9BACT|nr:hypothetical protein [Nannocystis poenicansa]WAS93649.1 hypothetical protein O0S08_46550 [Nannocystis poenicansa]
MGFDQKAYLDRAIAEASDAHGDVAPPWAKYPEIPARSIGWRMGYGESWAEVWHEWLSRAPTDRAWRLAYLKRHAPAPRTWASAAISTLAPEVRRRGELEDELQTELEAAGVIGDDVGLVAWERIHGMTPPAPWGRRKETPAHAVRYGTREFDFWARWCAKRRADGSLSAWLAAVPPAPEAWIAVREAAARGAPGEPVSASPYERAAVLLAAHGSLPAPWALGEDPASLREKYDEHDSYADAWSLWVSYRFDDAKTWRAYLQAQPRHPEAWAKTVRRIAVR